MLNIFGSSATATLDAIGKSLAVIELDPTGTVTWANENFCRVLGYSLEEIKGRHHRMFCERSYVESPDYKAFWAKLGRGEFEQQVYKRIAKNGAEVWIQASYNPVVSSGGSVTRIVKVATDITQARLKSAEDEGKIAAIGRAQAVIEFTTDGTILDANDLFLNVLGYRLDQIKGRHHRMFVEPAYAGSPEYGRFWERLRAGEFIADEFLRLGAGGKAVWIQASYNPIFDLNGKVFKVVKFATDVTDRVNAVERLADALSRLAKGDVEQQITTPLTPALDKLRVDFNRSVEALKALLGTARTTAEAVSLGTAEISAAASDLARRSEQQAASLEETAASLDEITTTVKRTAQATQEADVSMGKAKSAAEKSGSVVTKAVEAMAAIEQSSSHITQIISVIDEIAFQTNLLALNAGVEAARAGEAGRGFAVVASEVRGLAQRSAEAAKQIKTLIMQSTTHVSNGVELVASTGKSLEEIIAQVERVASIVGSINASTNEQATALSQVTTAISDLDQITQQNAAMVEEATAASGAINDKAVELADILAKFSGKANGAAAPQPAARPHPAPAARPVKRQAGGAALAVKAAPAAEAQDWQDF